MVLPNQALCRKLHSLDWPLSQEEKRGPFAPLGRFGASAGRVGSEARTAVAALRQGGDCKRSGGGWFGWGDDVWIFDLLGGVCAVDLTRFICEGCPSGRAASEAGDF